MPGRPDFCPTDRQPCGSFPSCSENVSVGSAGSGYPGGGHPHPLRGRHSGHAIPSVSPWPPDQAGSGWKSRPRLPLLCIPHTLFPSLLPALLDQIPGLCQSLQMPLPTAIWETGIPSLLEQPREVASGLPLWQKPLSGAFLRHSWGRTSCSSADTRVIWRRAAECRAGHPEVTHISLKEQSCHPHLRPLLC